MELSNKQILKRTGESLNWTSINKMTLVVFIIYLSWMSNEDIGDWLIWAHGLRKRLSTGVHFLGW